MRRVARGDRGAVAVLVSLLLAPVLLGAAAIGVDVARWLAVLGRVQRAADAAALAAAPLWASDRGAATALALAEARRNGYGPGATTSVVVTAGAEPTRVRVTVTTRVANPLGAVIGVPARDLSRVAEAEYAAPVSLGSSCNLLGNEPDPASGDGSDRADGGGSVASSLCPYGRRPNFWVGIAGPDTSAIAGDRFATRWCRTGGSGCRAGRNLAYYGGAESGPSLDGQPSQFLRITVRRPVSSLSIQVFDPAFVDVGNRCELMPRRSATDPGWPGPDRPNAYVADAGRRYAFGSPTTRPPSGGEFCTGDAMFAEAGVPAGLPLAPVVTTYALHAPAPGGDPWRAPVIAGCVRQFAGWTGGAAELGRALSSASPADRPLQRVFRQWVTVCTIGSPRVGDYYLQVRTNLPLGAATAARVADPREDPSATGSGINRLAVRVDAPGAQAAVSVAGFERIEAFVNLSGASASFLLARVGSVAAGSTLRVELFDIGDAAEPATLRLVRPPDASGTWAGRCRAVGDVRGSPTAPVELADCVLTGVSAAAGFDGRVQRFDVDIPPDYRCADGDPDACWFRVAVDYRSAVSDTTTWSATLEGDPVRLVR